MDESAQVNPANPTCPVCGATEWFAYPQIDYALLVVKRGTTEAIVPDRTLVQPVEGFVCRSCRFLRLRVVQGTLELPDPQ